MMLLLLRAEMMMMITLLLMAPTGKLFANLGGRIEREMGKRKNERDDNDDTSD